MEQTMKQKKPVLPEEEKNRTRSRKNKRIKQFLPLYIMLLPGIVYLIINNYLPMGGLVIAFKKVNYAVGIFNSPWAGLSNFKFLFSNNDALNALRNTVLYNLGFILFGNILAITVAIALDCVKSKFLKRFSQVVILIPYLLSTVIVSYIVYAFLNPTNGFVNNSVLPLLGIDPIKWYNVPKYWPVILTIVYLWMSFGYSSILYYSTIIGIDKSLYEAAVMDGATTWQQICHVTLPSHHAGAAGRGSHLLFRLRPILSSSSAQRPFVFHHTDNRYVRIPRIAGAERRGPFFRCRLPAVNPWLYHGVHSQHAGF